MTLRNVPITYTLDQQRQEINNLANDVNDIDVNFNEKIDDRINGLITAGTGIAAVYDDTANTYTLALDFTEFNTTNLTEGVNGLFYTSARAISEIDNRVTKTFVNNLEVTELGNLAELNLQSGSDSATVTASNYNHNNWDTAFAWGNHASAGYITSVGAIALNDITDVNVTGVVTDGHVLKWDGGTSRWIAAPDLSGGGGGGGGGISLTDISANSLSASGTGTLTYNSTSGAFTYTPPDLSSFSTFSGSYTDLANKPSIPSGINDLGDVDTTTTAPAVGEILKWDGSNWVPGTDATGGASTGLSSRTTASATATSLATATDAEITITAAKAFSLLKIETTHASWVTLYTDTTSRTADSSRTETTDPLPGSGVIAEIITSDGATQRITPGTIGWNNDPGAPTTNIYAKVVNKSGSTADITVTLTYVQIEA
tara:strand:- start:105 stop:1391 length:1287 start_codon:yes stop_codon:yes gene_type:complete